MSHVKTREKPRAAPLEIELLYFDGCPSYKTVWNDMLEVITGNDLDVTVRPIKVNSLEEAKALRFAGSPTVRVNGVDLEGREEAGVMACRVYQENGGKGYPSKELLRKRLMEHL